MKRAKKRGIGAILPPVVAILILTILFMTVVRNAGKANDTSIGDELDKKTNTDGFEVYEDTMSVEEKMIDDSMKALKAAIDAVASDVPPEVVKANTFAESNIDYVKIHTWANYDIEWIDRDDLKHQYTPALSPQQIQESGHGVNVYGYYWYDTDKKGYKKQNIIDYDYVNNIGLEVKYKDQSMPTCTVYTHKDAKKKESEFGGNSLLSAKNNDIDKCKNSPTVLQCPYVTIYFCKEHTYLPKEQRTNTEGLPGAYEHPYWGNNGHSRASLEFYVEFNEEVARSLKLKREGWVKWLMRQLSYAVKAVRRAWSSIPLIGGHLEYDPEKPYCDGGIDIGSDVQVKCQKSGGSIDACVVCGFNLPQDFTDEWIKSVGDPLYLAYYEAFPTGPQTYWQFDMGNAWAMVGMSMAIGAVGELILPAGGKLIKALGVGKLAKAFGKEAAESLLKEASEELLTEAGEKLLKEGIEKLGKEGVDLYVKRAAARNMIRNAVEASNLDAAASEKVIKTLTKKLDDTIMDQLSATGTKATKNAAKELNEKSAKEFTKSLESEVFDAGTYTKNALDGFDKVVKPDGTIDYVAKSASQVDEIFPDNQAVKEVSDEIAKEMSDIMNKKLPKGAAQDVLAHATMRNAIGEVLEDGGKKISKEAFSEAMEVAFKRMKSINKLPLKFQNQIYASAQKKASYLFSKKGSAILNKMSTDTFVESLDEGIDEAISHVGVSHVRGLMNKLSTVSGQASLTKRGAKFVLPTRLPSFPLNWAKPIASPLKSIKNLAIHPIKSAKGAAKGIASDLATPFKPQNLRWAALVAIVLSTYQDEINEKSMPMGYNSLAVAKPSMLGEAAREYTLKDEAGKFFISLHERYASVDEKPNIRFYFASPCETDIVIRETVCTCAMRPDMRMFNFGGGPITVKDGTIFTSDEATYEQKKKIGEMIRANVKRNDYSINDIESFKKHPEYDLIDYSMTIKECESRGTWDGVKHFFSSGPTDYEEFNTECIVAEPTVAPGSENYCYARFPISNQVKYLLSVGEVVAGVVLGVMAPFTGGTSLMVMMAIGAGAEGAKAAITEFWQKWPGNEEYIVEGNKKLDRKITEVVDSAIGMRTVEDVKLEYNVKKK
jgi:hypothetical protein